MTHFSDADGERGIARAAGGVRARRRTTCRANASLANSAAILRHAPRPRVRADWVRAGHHELRQRARLPAPRHRALGPAADDDAALAAHRDAAACRPATASATAAASRAEQPLRIGIVACGYADGYPRHAPAPARRCWWTACARGTVGRVSMDMITVDLTPVPHAGIGSEVTLWGHGPAGSAAADRRGGACRRHDRLRADVRAGAARAGARSRLSDGRDDALAGRLDESEVELHRGPRAGRRRPERQQGVQRGALRFDIARVVACPTP